MIQTASKGRNGEKTEKPGGSNVTSGPFFVWSYLDRSWRGDTHRTLFLGVFAFPPKKVGMQSGHGSNFSSVSFHWQIMKRCAFKTHRHPGWTYSSSGMDHATRGGQQNLTILDQPKEHSVCAPPPCARHTNVQGVCRWHGGGSMTQCVLDNRGGSVQGSGGRNTVCIFVSFFQGENNSVELNKQHTEFWGGASYTRRKMVLKSNSRCSAADAAETQSAPDQHLLFQATILPKAVSANGMFPHTLQESANLIPPTPTEAWDFCKQGSE